MAGIDRTTVGGPTLPSHPERRHGRSGRARGAVAFGAPAPDASAALACEDRHRMRRAQHPVSLEAPKRKTPAVSAESGLVRSRRVPRRPPRFDLLRVNPCPKKKRAGPRTACRERCEHRSRQLRASTLLFALALIRCAKQTQFSGRPMTAKSLKRKHLRRPGAVTGPTKQSQFPAPPDRRTARLQRKGHAGQPLGQELTCLGQFLPLVAPNGFGEDDRRSYSLKGMP